MRVVLDLNVVVSGLITPGGSSEKVVLAFFAGEFEVVACPRWLEEVDEVLAREKFTRRAGVARAEELRALVREFAVQVSDPVDVPALARDRDDDYLLALAAENACDAVVSGDDHLLELAQERPVWTVRELLDRLAAA